jgi:cellulose synthase/poly-beta-1,6-N-acetylglucosamine synthase-like glycosyltransferase
VGFAIVLVAGEATSTIGLILLIVLPIVLALAVLIYAEEIHRIMFYALHYTLMIPTFVNILPIYAITQTDDLSWGTRPGHDASEIKSIYQAKKTWYILVYIVSNV